MEASVSVIIPCYNCCQTIRRTINSITQQSLKPAEVILVDDCSTDETLNILKELQQQLSKNWIKIISLFVNSGPATARNAGLSVATQDYVAFLDADDIWHPDKIKIQYTWMRENSDIILSGHRCISIESENKISPIDSAYSLRFKRVFPYQILLSNRIATSSLMVKSNSNYRFNETQRYADDHLYLMAIILEQNKVVFLEETLAYRFRPYFSSGGLGGDLWKFEKEELKNYKIIASSAKLFPLFLYFLLIWSYLKYLRRIIINLGRKINLNSK